MAGLKVDPVRVAQARMGLPRALSQAQAAHRLDVHPVTLNRIENGKANVSLELLERMCALYECSRAHLLGEPEKRDPVEEARLKFAESIAKISEGFDDFTDVIDALTEQARQASDRQVAA